MLVTEAAGNTAPEIDVHLIHDRLERCRAEINSHEPYIQLDQLLIWGRLANRQRNEELGVIEFTFEALRNRECSDSTIRACLWGWLQSFVIVDDLDDKREISTIDVFASRGGIELAVNELTIPSCNYGTIVLSTLAWCSMNSTHIPRILGTGIHKDAIAHIAAARSDLLDISMALVRGLCGSPGATRRTLRADGAVEAVVPFLADLEAADEEEVHVRRGFRAASVVARLAGGESSGIGPSVLQGNWRLIRRTLEMLDKVLDAGPRGTVINMAIDPHLITMDVFIISSFHANRRLMRSLGGIRVLLRALRLRGEGNLVMVVDILKTFLNLIQERSCARILKSLRVKIKEMLSAIFRGQRFDAEAINLARSLIWAVEQPQEEDDFSDDSYASEEEEEFSCSEEEDSSSEFDDDFDMEDCSEESIRSPDCRNQIEHEEEENPGMDLVSDSQGEDDEDSIPAYRHDRVAPLPRSSKVQVGRRPRRPRVMLSYHWRHMDIVMKVEALLKEHHVDVWVDYDPRGCQAAYNPSSAIVFMSPEFFNCPTARDEYQYFTETKVPVFTLFCEPVDLPGLNDEEDIDEPNAALFPSAAAAWNPALLEQSLYKLFNVLQL